MNTKPKPPLIQITGTETGRSYWRSLDELAGTKEFKEWLQYEFPEGADLAPDAASRRTLLKLMGASLALAGLTACTRPVENILPASKGSTATSLASRAFMPRPSHTPVPFRGWWSRRTMAGRQKSKATPAIRPA